MSRDIKISAGLPPLLILKECITAPELTKNCFRNIPGAWSACLPALQGNCPAFFWLEKKKKPVAEQYADEFSNRNIGIVRLNHCVGRDGITNLRTRLGLHGVDEFYVGTVYKG